MNKLSAWSNAVTALETTCNELANLGSRLDNRRPQDLIALRRQLSAQLAGVNDLSETLFRASGRTDVHAEYRSRYSAMRSAIAYHQANWPATTMNAEQNKYFASARSVTSSCQEFIKWLRTEMLHKE